MLRRLFPFLTIVSLLLCAATCVMWVRSYWVGETYIVLVSDNRDLSAAHATGTLWLSTTLWTPPPEWATTFTIPAGYFRHPPGTAEFEDVYGPGFLGFGYDYQSHPIYLLRVVGIPYWFVFAVFLALPALRLVQSQRRKRLVSRNRCPSCGYDLRASQERCPECGAAPEKAAGRV